MHVRWKQNSTQHVFLRECIHYGVLIQRYLRSFFTETCKSSIPSHDIAALNCFARWRVTAHPHRGSYCTPHWNVVTQTSQYGSINHINTSTLHSCSSKPIPHLKMPTPHLKRPTPHLKRLFVRPQVATRKPRGVKALFPYVILEGI